MSSSSIGTAEEEESLPRDMSPRRRFGVVCACISLVVVVMVVVVTVSQLIDGNKYENNNNNNNNNNNGSAADNDEAESSPSSSPPSAQQPTTTSTTMTMTMTPTHTGYQACNGFESLCDVRVNEIMFGVLHNAVSTAQDGTLVLYNHELRLESALEAGYRGLNFDVGKCESSFADDQNNNNNNNNNSSGGVVRLVHGLCALGTRDPIQVFTNIQTFLSHNPNEVLLMPVQIDNDGLGETTTTTTLQEIYDIMLQVPGFADLLYDHPAAVPPGTDGISSGVPPWPTLRQLIAANTRILFFTYNGEACSTTTTTTTTGNSSSTANNNNDDGCPPGFHDWFRYASETQFELSDIETIQNNKEYSCNITRGRGGERDFFAINLFTTIPDYDSCKILNANEFAKNHLTECSNLNGGRRPNAIIIDCWDAGEILQVVDEYNAQLVPPVIVLANVTMQLTGLASEMSEEGQEMIIFQTQCSNYFADQLSPGLTNVYCQILSQEVTTSQQQQQQQQQQKQRWRRKLQESASLQVTCQVSGDAPDDGSFITTDRLQSILEVSSNELVQSLSQADTFFATVEQISSSSATADDPENESPLPTAMLPSSPPALLQVTTAPTQQPESKEETSSLLPTFILVLKTPAPSPPATLSPSSSKVLTPSPVVAATTTTAPMQPGSTEQTVAPAAVAPPPMTLAPATTKQRAGSSEPTDSPTFFISETNSPTSSRFSSVISLATSNDLSDIQDLIAEGSPQRLAAEWIADGDPRQVTIQLSLDFIQRYVLAVLYYAVGDTTWLYELNWLSGDDVCAWVQVVIDEDTGTTPQLGVLCTAEGVVRAINLPLGGTAGSIPDEISLLTDLEGVDGTDGNTTTVPSPPPSNSSIAESGGVNVSVNTTTVPSPSNATIADPSSTPTISDQ